MYVADLGFDSDSRDEGDPELQGAEKEKELKRVLIIVGARFLFYPTLLYNVIRNKIQSEFHWWDLVDEFVLLGAVPFPMDVLRLKQIGVQGVVTLNEPYETLVPSSLYLAHGIDHLVVPTRDYLFAPSFGDICQAVDFIHTKSLLMLCNFYNLCLEKASDGKTTYVHCKAGRGRSTTIVLCYLIQHRKMSPSTAYEYVKSSRPRVLLAAAQRQGSKLVEGGTVATFSWRRASKTLSRPQRMELEQRLLRWATACVTKPRALNISLRVSVSG